MLYITFSPQNKVHRVNLLPALFSLLEELIGNSGCVLSDFTSRVKLHSKSIWIIKLINNIHKFIVIRQLFSLESFSHLLSPVKGK